jgi:hypothetical protein
MREHLERAQRAWASEVQDDEEAATADGSNGNGSGGVH